MVHRSHQGQVQSVSVTCWFWGDHSLSVLGWTQSHGVDSKTWIFNLNCGPLKQNIYHLSILSCWPSPSTTPKCQRGKAFTLRWCGDLKCSQSASQAQFLKRIWLITWICMWSPYCLWETQHHAVQHSESIFLFCSPSWVLEGFSGVSLHSEELVYLLSSVSVIDIIYFHFQLWGRNLTLWKLSITEPSRPLFST